MIYVIGKEVQWRAYMSHQVGELSERLQSGRLQTPVNTLQIVRSVRFLGVNKRRCGTQIIRTEGIGSTVLLDITHIGIAKCLSPFWWKYGFGYLVCRNQAYTLIVYHDLSRYWFYENDVYISCMHNEYMIKRTKQLIYIYILLNAFNHIYKGCLCGFRVDI